MKLNWKRWLIVVYLLSLMAFTTSVLLIPGEKYNTLTTSDSGWEYGIAVEIDKANGFVDNNPLSHAPYGHSVDVNLQGQPLMTVMLYRGIRSISPGVELMDVVRYWSPLLFALSLIPIFLIGRELGGDLAGCSAAFFASVLTGSVYWMKVGAFDREAIQLLLGAWTIYLTVRLFKAPPRSIPIFAVLGGLVYGLFGLSWAGGALYLVPVIVGGLVLCLLLGFVGKLIRGSKLSEAASLTGDENARLVIGVFGMLAVMGIVIYALGGMNIWAWVSFIQTLFGHVPVSTGAMAALIAIGGGLFGYICIRARAKMWGYAGCLVIIAVCALVFYSLGTMVGEAEAPPRYAGEMAPPGSWGETIRRFYWEDILTKFALVFAALALAKICWSRKRWELVMLPWLVIIAGLVWPGRGMVRFDRMWWPFVAVAAGMGAAALISIFKWLSRESMTAEWVKPLQKPVVIAFCFSLAATPFIINVSEYARGVDPPPQWHGRGLDKGFIDTFTWLRENTPENSIIAIGWSYGHLLTGVARRMTVADGTETMGKLGEWEKEPYRSPPPDYIYWVEGNERKFPEHGLHPLYRANAVNGRRPDVDRLTVTGDENEFANLLRWYRDNYGCQIDYVIFDRPATYAIYNYEILATTWGALSEFKENGTITFSDGNWIISFDDREVIFDPQRRLAYVQQDGENRYLAGVQFFYPDLVYIPYPQIPQYFGPEPYFYPEPDVHEFLLLVLTREGGLTRALLARFAGVPTIYRVFNDFDLPNFVYVVYTSPDGLVRVVKIDHENLL